ncbi:MAG: hypothetical protein JW728_06605 [Candidatus Aureabacteria bacterium]|nr:hypothetical protein [Candidatus Auribacterota bacterium]
MDKTLLIVLVDKRKESAVTVQKILTEWGCIIKTRLGIHDGLLDNCSNSGLIVLELVGQKQKQDELARKLNLLEGVQAKMVELSLKGK